MTSPAWLGGGSGIFCLWHPHCTDKNHPAQRAQGQIGAPWQRVANDKSWSHQTREHTPVCDIMGPGDIASFPESRVLIFLAIYPTQSISPSGNIFHPILLNSLAQTGLSLISGFPVCLKANHLTFLGLPFFHLSNGEDIMSVLSLRQCKYKQHYSYYQK